MLGEMTDADKVMHPQHFGRAYRSENLDWNRGSLVLKFGVGRGLHSLSARVVVIIVTSLSVAAVCQCH